MRTHGFDIMRWLTLRCVLYGKGGVTSCYLNGTLLLTDLLEDRYGEHSGPWSSVKEATHVK